VGVENQWFPARKPAAVNTVLLLLLSKWCANDYWLSRQ